MTARSPSSDAARHLLPPGEKENSAVGFGGETSTTSPSPLVGEGARRVGEGVRTSSARLKSFSRSMRKNPTEAEATLWRLLRDRRFVGHKFRRQVPIGPYIADFVCYTPKLVVELDGSQHAESESDQKRDAELQRRGFQIIRVWNNDLNQRQDSVLDAIWHALQVEDHQ